MYIYSKSIKEFSPLIIYTLILCTLYYTLYMYMVYTYYRIINFYIYIYIKVNDLYTTYDLYTLKFRQKFQKLTGIALPIFHGVNYTMMPYKRPIKIIIGEGIQTPKVKHVNI